MARFVGLDVSQKLTVICVVDEAGYRLWRGQCATDPGQIERIVRGHAGEDNQAWRFAPFELRTVNQRRSGTPIRSEPTL